MIISKTPYRISFFGGGSDYPSWYKHNFGEVISASINKYIYIAVKRYEPFFQTKFRITYSRIENTNSINKIQHNVVRKALKRYKFNSGLEINYFADLPSNSGIGSSSSFTVGLINSLNTLKKKKLTKENLSKESIFFEQNILKENVGSQDQIACAYGGINNIKFIKINKFKVLPLLKKKNFFNRLSKNLFIVFSGISRNADQISKSYTSNLKNKKQYIDEILSHVNIAKKIIKNEDRDEFGRLLGETWNVKKKLGKIVTNQKIDFLYNKGLQSGALGGKLLGAGSGGFILFYVKDGNKEKFFKAFSNKIIIPIEFSYEGSSIILSSKNLT